MFEHVTDISFRWLAFSRDIHDDMTFKVIRGQGQGEQVTSVSYRDYFYCHISIIRIVSFYC